MKIAIISKGGNELDEGMKKYGKQIYNNIKFSDHNVRFFNIYNIGSLEMWKELYVFGPDIIHLIPGVTSKNLLLLYSLKKICKSTTIVNVLQNNVNPTIASVDQISPDIALVQSKSSVKIFNNTDTKINWIGSGVDLDKFDSNITKLEARNKLGIETKNEVYLHVGHIKEGRNVESLAQLTEHGKVIVVGSPKYKPNQQVLKKLKKSGCKVVIEYIPNIQIYYTAADYYIFPTKEENNSIPLPLSILESLAAGTPVISTKYGGIQDWFDQSESIQFVDEINSENVLSQRQMLVNDNTRDLVKNFTWENISNEIVEMYCEEYDKK